MNHALFGVMGHVDHGKTALVQFLTGTDTDRLAEEKARGISIALGFAHFSPGKDTDIDLIDMPGHERFVRTMISGATGVDAILLVVAANEGIKPQTIECVDIAALLNLDRAIVAVSKADLVTPEVARKVADDVSDLLTRSGLRGPPPIVTSVQTGQGMDELRRALHHIAQDQPSRACDGTAWLPIDRAFSVAGHGTVVTGTLRGGAVSPGEPLELLPSGQPVRIRSVQVHGQAVAVAHPGERVALNVRDIAADDVHRGMALGAKGALVQSEWLTLAIRAVDDAPQMPNGMRLRVLVGTGDVEARLRLLDRDILEPGQRGFAQIRLAEPLAVPAREIAILRIASPSQTVAGGRILETHVKRKRRFDSAALSRLEGLRDLPVPELVATEIEHKGKSGTSLSALGRLTALSEAALARHLGNLPIIVTRKGTVFRTSDLDDMAQSISGLLALNPVGLSRNQLLSALSGTRAPLLDEALSQLMRGNVLLKRGSHYALHNPEDDRVHAENEAETARQIAQLLKDAGLMPPNPNALITDAQAKRAVEKLLRDGTLVRAVDRAKGRELVFHNDAIAEAQSRLEPHLASDKGLLVTEIAAILGISRKFTMPLLDHLDTKRFTKRVGDRRHLFASTHVP